MRTSCTNMNFGFKPLLYLHLNYVNIKPKTYEIQNREQLIADQDGTGLSFHCYWMGQRRTSLFKVFSFYMAMGSFASCLTPASHFSLDNAHFSSKWTFICYITWCQITNNNSIQMVKNLFLLFFFLQSFSYQKMAEISSSHSCENENLIPVQEGVKKIVFIISWHWLFEQSIGKQTGCLRSTPLCSTDYPLFAQE